MKKNSLWKSREQMVRVLELKKEKVFVIDCVKRAMPYWVITDSLSGYEECTEAEMIQRTGAVIPDIEKLDAESRRFIREHFTMIAPVLPFVSDMKQRTYIINQIAAEKNVSKQTIRNYLCLYLVYQNEVVFCPKQKEEKELTEDEKNMRWGLNKFYYNQNKNSISTAYTMMLRAKYCDESGRVLPEHPSILFYNSKRIIENYPFTEDMLQERVLPTSCSIWDYGLKQASADLLDITSEELILTLLPRTEGRFTRQGLKVNGMRYRHDNYTEKYLCGGTVTVVYNPEDVSCIWLLENGSYIRFELIESRYRNKNLEEVESIKTGQKAVIKAFAKEQTQAQVDLVNHIEMIAFQTDYKGQTKIKGIRENRRKEQIKTHKDYVKVGV